MEKKHSKFGAEKAQWNLDCFYKGVNDPQIDIDVQSAVEMIKKFHADYKGQLSTKLGPALTAYGEMICLLYKISVFLSLKSNLNVTDAAVTAKSNDVDRTLRDAESEFLTFFNFEVVSLDDDIINHLTKTDVVVARYRPMIDEMRREKSHMLSEEVEMALSKRSAFGAGSWSGFFEEMEANLKFNFRGKLYTFNEMIELFESSNANTRAQALKAINDELGGIFANYSAQTLNIIAGAKAVEDKERGHPNPMSVRNKDNDVSDATVDSLHMATEIFAGPLVKRYYRLKGLLMGIHKLRWSDRSAGIPILGGKEKKLPFDRAFELVVSAYRDFSPTMADLVVDMMAEGRIDAPAVPNKHSGAFNCSLVLPGNRPVSFTLMNYRGTSRDVMTLAHELGHSVHGLLSGAAQGPLMAHASMAFCETASTFGEMLVFNHLKDELANSSDKEKLLKLLMERISDTINTTVRQINFSNFERRVHGAKRWLSVEDMDAIWLETTKAFYGQEGEVFTYENMNHFWSYIHHFHRPFYVYCYAFAELLTYSLYAQRAVLGSSFEPLYLDFLRAGGSKSTKDLLQPFGLNAEDPSFWANGIKISLEALVVEAENLCRELGFAVPQSESLLLPASTLIS